jgi:hypothetical protein
VHSHYVRALPHRPHCCEDRSGKTIIGFDHIASIARSMQLTDEPLPADTNCNVSTICVVSADFSQLFEVAKEL